MRTLTAMGVSMLGVAIVATSAAAEPLPDVTPDHDFRGTYLITQPSGAKTATVAYNAGVRAARIDLPDSPGYVLIDFGTHDFKMVMPAQHAYMDLAALAAQGRLLMGSVKGGGAPAGATPPAAPPEIESLGTETIAGHICRLTKVTDTSDGSWTEICATAGGIILHIRTDKGDDVTAQSISEAPVAAAEVEIPQGYTPIVMPGMPGGMQLPPGMAMPGMPMPGNAPGQ